MVPSSTLPPSPPRSPKKRVVSNSSISSSISNKSITMKTRQTSKSNTTATTTEKKRIPKAVPRCWEPEPERGRKRYRSFEFLDNPVISDDDAFDSDAAFAQDDDLDHGIPTMVLPPPWSSYNFALPPHEPPFPSPPLTPISDISSWSSSASACSDLSVLSSTTSSFAVGSSSHVTDHRNFSSPPRSPEPPLAEPRGALTRQLIVGTGLYLANQTTLYLADALLDAGVGEWGKACLRTSSALSCALAMVSVWGIERVGRQARRTGRCDGMAAAERTWRRRWANIDKGLGWAVLLVIALSIFGALAMGMAELVSTLQSRSLDCSCASVSR